MNTSSLVQKVWNFCHTLRAAFADELVLQDPSGEPASVLLARIRAERTAQMAVKNRVGARYPGSPSGEVNRRVGPEVPYRTLKRALDQLVEQGRVRFAGQARGRRYWVEPEI